MHFYIFSYIPVAWLSLWESCQRKLTERTFLTLSALRALPHRGRQVLLCGP